MTFFSSFQLSEPPHVTRYYATMRLTELNMYRTQNIPVIAHSCQIKILHYYGKWKHCMAKSGMICQVKNSSAVKNTSWGPSLFHLVARPITSKYENGFKSLNYQDDRKPLIMAFTYGSGGMISCVICIALSQLFTSNWCIKLAKPKKEKKINWYPYHTSHKHLR